MKKVLIVGSCCSRDAFSLVDTANKFEIVGYYERSSFGCMASPVVKSQAVLQNVKSNFGLKMIGVDLKKDLFKIIKNASCDILCIDCIDERFNILEMPDGSRRTLSLEYMEAQDRSKNQGVLIPNGSKRHLDFVLEGWNSFFNIASNNSAIKKIILNELYWTNDSDSGSHFEDQEIKYANSFLSSIYDHVKKIYTN